MQPRTLRQPLLEGGNGYLHVVVSRTPPRDWIVGTSFRFCTCPFPGEFQLLCAQLSPEAQVQLQEDVYPNLAV